MAQGLKLFARVADSGREGVDIVRLPDGRVTLGPDTFQASAVAPGVYRVTSGERSARVYVAGPPEARWVFANGHTFEIELTAIAAPRAARRAHHDGLAAPMPATVIKVLAAPGQRVRQGDTLMMLEAMKMELPVRSPRDGSVGAIHCREGDLVQAGSRLLDLEEP